MERGKKFMSTVSAKVLWMIENYIEKIVHESFAYIKFWSIEYVEILSKYFSINKLLINDS